jgi:hypothetical protein
MHLGVALRPPPHKPGRPVLPAAGTKREHPRPRQAAGRTQAARRRRGSGGRTSPWRTTRCSDVPTPASLVIGMFWSGARHGTTSRIARATRGYLTESAAASASSDPRYQVAQCRRDAPPSRVGATRRHAHLPRVCDVWHDAPSARCSEARRAGARHARRKPRRAAATRTADSPRESKRGRLKRPTEGEEGQLFTRQRGGRRATGAGKRTNFLGNPPGWRCAASQDDPALRRRTHPLLRIAVRATRTYPAGM